MKSAIKNPMVILFAIVYLLSCLTITKVNGAAIIKYYSIPVQILKFAVIFLLNYIVTVINKRNTTEISKFCSGITVVTAFLFVADYYFTKISGDLYEQLLWLSAVNLAFLGVYFGLITVKDDNFKANAAKIIKGYAFIYIGAIIILFLRPIGENATVNLIIGKGTFSFIPYLCRKPFAWQVWLVVIGNCVFFIPFPFIIKTICKKIKDSQLVIIGFIIPIIIEGYQLIFKCGDVDIDDFILNFGGFVIGLLLLKLQDKLRKDVKS